MAFSLVFAGPIKAYSADFTGFRALVVQPENRWDWDAAIYGALESRGFDVVYATNGLPDAAGLSGYDLVAGDTRRFFTLSETGRLRDFVDSGGAFYGSWGGPFSSPGMLDMCGVRGIKSVRLMEIKLVSGTPLAKGLGVTRIALPSRVGHMDAEAAGWEIVALEPAPGGIIVARDVHDRALGVLGRHGKGRTDVLGFGPEMGKQFADQGVAGPMLDNLLGWLVEGKTPRRQESGHIRLALPAATEVKSASLDGVDAAFQSRREGSLIRVELDAGSVEPGRTAVLRVGYGKIEPRRRVETIIHLPWDTLVSAAKSPAEMAGYLKDLNATVCQPLLRGGNGMVWYKGVPGDEPRPELSSGYNGDFLLDLIRECHSRGIKVIGGAYQDNSVLKNRPEAARVDRDGKPVKNQYGSIQACFGRDEVQEFNLNLIRRLITDYPLDGVMLDDNFELGGEECFCDSCRRGFAAFCAGRGLPPGGGVDPESETAKAAWMDFRRQATRDLALRIGRLTKERGVPLGGWTGVSARPELSGIFDLYGLMVYTASPDSARLAVATADRAAVTVLLWAPHSVPRLMEAEVREAVRAGAAVVGFWIRGEDGGYRMDPARTAAMSRALGSVEREWSAYYRENVLAGDPRFSILEGEIGSEEAVLKLKNAGKPVRNRIEGAISFPAVLSGESRK